MSLTRPPLGLIKAPHPAEAGDGVVYDGDSLSLESRDQNSYLRLGLYDGETGTLRLIKHSGAELIIEGFLTENNIPRGPIGPTGPKGLTGTPGKDGMDGIQGDPGCQGPKGCPGAKGARGYDGPIGPTGPDGISGTGTGGNDGQDAIRMYLEEILKSVEDKLSVEGGTITGDLNISGLCHAFGFVSTSSEVHKENIKTLFDGSFLLSALRPVSFDWKKTKKEDFGLIAEEVKKVLPSLVEKDGDGNLGVKYQSIIAILISNVLDLNSKYSALESRVESLEMDRGN